MTTVSMERTETIGAARRALAQAFRAAGLDSPELDAHVLVGYALGLNRTALLSNTDRKLNAVEADTIAALKARRLAREPIARITGRKEFWSLEFAVTPATLVPRPETETVVEAALATVDANGSRAAPLRLLDLGTGSGVLLVALMSELPHAVGIGTDMSRAALAAARANAARHGVGDRAHFVASDFGAALAGSFDVVVANPPYVASGTIAALAPEVRDHDPALALDGGSDGLAAYRAIAADIGRLLAPSGMLVTELGAGQCKAVARLFAERGLVIRCTVNDFAGIPRALTVNKMP
jgi:release factor glutamine methyltransferase